MNPTTIEEWAEYIGTLSGTALFNKALAANSIEFVRRLESEGTSPADIEGILTLFAQQFEADDQSVPSGGSYIDFNDLLIPLSMPL